jgi:hypothetical protein
MRHLELRSLLYRSNLQSLLVLGQDGLVVKLCLSVPLPFPGERVWIDRYLRELLRRVLAHKSLQDLCATGMVVQEACA